MATDLVVQPAATPMELLNIAVSQGADIEKLKQLMDLQERWEKNEARKAFVSAMNAFKAEAIVVLKDKLNQQYNSKYVSLENLVATVTPYLSKHGLTADWDVDQAAGIKITCIVTHVMGHFKTTSMICPPDTSGKKNPIQEIKSSITYGKTCTYESALGLASSNGNLSDDGNGGGTNGDLLPADKVKEQVEWLGNARNIEELQKLFKNAYTMASEAKDKSAQAAFIKAKDARKRELQ